MTKVITDTILILKYHEQHKLFDTERNLQNKVTGIHSSRLKQPLKETLQKQIMYCQSFAKSGF